MLTNTNIEVPNFPSGIGETTTFLGNRILHIMNVRRVVLENDNYNLYTNRTFSTGKNVPFNPTDIKMTDKINKEAEFIDI